MKLRHFLAAPAAFSTLAVAAGFALSPLALAAAADTRAVEFLNVGLDHYFITASASEALAIDNGAAGPGWTRTGRSFGVWSNPTNAPADAAPVCRFYSAGANSHFFTASAAECASLKALESVERRQAVELGRVFTGWSFEGIAFHALTPATVAAAAANAAKSATACGAGTEDIFRAYNDGFANGRGANHRFVNDASLRTLMEDRGWISEGVAFCSPVQASGTSAPAMPATGSFPELAASWAGNAKWEFETKPSGVQTETTAPLSLAITEAGVVTGSGGGCTFAGSIAEVDGFRALYEGSFDATACTGARFAAHFDLAIERLTSGPLRLHLRNETATGEAQIEAMLAATSTPSVTQPPAAGGPRTWVGTVAWLATQKSSGNETTLVSVNQPLTLTLDGPTLTGSGFGCTFAGTLQAGAGGVQSGTVTATGCEQSIFDGAYAQVDIHAEDGNALEVEMERETESGGASTKRTIRGTLNAGGGTTGTTVTPPPTGSNTAPPTTGSGPGTTPPAFTLAGMWSADDVSWTAEIRQGKTSSQFISGSHPLTLTIAADNNLSGSGFGCAWTGSAQAVTGSTTAFTATLQASGCTEGAFDGAYAGATLQADDRALEIEIQREVESGDTKTKIRIDGTLRKS